jgi:hypothetical protein
MKEYLQSNGFKPFTFLKKMRRAWAKNIYLKLAPNGWVFVSGFALHNAQFKGQMLMAKLAQIPCYRQYG